MSASSPQALSSQGAAPPPLGGGAAPLGGSLAPVPVKAIPVRHWGQWVGAAVVVYLLVAFVLSLARNPNIEWDIIGDYLFKDLTLRGVWVTLYLTVVSMAIGIVGGTLLAVMRLSDNPVLSSIAYGYIWFFRGTPVLVQILVWAYLGALYPELVLGIPIFGPVFASAETNAVIGATAAGILGLGLNEAAYAAELVRAGIISVDKGQQEAALSLGMGGGQTMWSIILPQAMRVIIPPMGNETISMLKTSALVSVIAGHDLLTNLQKAYAQNFRIMELLLVACIWYLFLTTLLSIGQHYLEAYFSRGFGAQQADRAQRRAFKRAQRRGESGAV